MKKVLPVGMIIFDAVLFLFYFLLDGALSLIGGFFTGIPFFGDIIKTIVSWIPGFSTLFSNLRKIAILPACLLLIIIIFMMISRILQNRKFKKFIHSTVDESLNQAQPASTISVNGTSPMKTNASSSAGNKMEVF